MNINMKHKLALLIGTTFVGASFAQTPPMTAGSQPVAIPVQQVQAQPQNESAINGMTPPNTFEKEVTPLLREISRKKSVLELRKLEREIEKLDEDALKAQAERERGAMAQAPGMGAVGGNGLYNPTVFSAPGGMPNGGQTSVQDDTPVLKVLMIYGFADSLYAKVASGKQGGFVLKKGDVTPDGRVVVDIKPNFIEVAQDKSSKAKKEKTTRIFISSEERKTTGGGSAPGALPPGQGSASIAPVSGPATPFLTPIQVK